MGAYIPKYFQPYELVPSSVYQEFLDEEGNLDINFWFLFDNRLLITADRLRKFYDCSITANDWYWGGEFQYRVYRPPDCDEGALWSQHRFARAMDCIFDGVSVEKVRQDILAAPNAYPFQYITTLELGIQWLHFDTRNWDKSENGIFTFSQ